MKSLNQPRVHPHLPLVLMLVASLLTVSASYGARKPKLLNLVPATPGKTPDYYCTWATENYVWGQGAASIDNNRLFGGTGMVLGYAGLNETEIFKPGGWADFFPKVRGDLVFLLDDGYFPPGKGHTSFELDPAKFPSFTKGTPPENLKQLNEQLKARGWRGLGLWTRGRDASEAANREKIEWSRDAGLLYWKVDGGDWEFVYPRLAKELYPALTLEHAIGTGVFNLGAGNRVDANYGPSRLPGLEHSDVIRIYDRDQPISLPTTIDRVTALLQVAQGKPQAKAIINCEDEEYVGAAFGCSVGIFRSPRVGLRPNGDMDIYMGGPKQNKRRIDEVTRAIRWHRLAPPFAANLGELQVDTNILSDSWKFSQGDSWDTSVTGKVVTQSAPARVARGLPLPIVTAQGDAPWVLASRNPSGAVTIAALGRMTPEKGWFIPPAAVSLTVGALPPAIGIFGRYKSLTLLFNQSVKGKRVWAQDLAGEQAEDVTKKVTIKGNAITFDGALLQRVGLAAATPGDLSDPGLVMVLR